MSTLDSLPILNSKDAELNKAEAQEQESRQKRRRLQQKTRRQHKQAYEIAIKGKFTLTICPVRINHIGLPRSGKTTFRRRMMGEILNILKAMERGKMFEPSTGIAEIGGQVFIRSTSTDLGTIQSKVWSVLKDFGEEASMLNQVIFQVVSNSKSSSTQQVSSEAMPTPKAPASISEASFQPKRSMWKSFLSLFNKEVGVKAPSQREMDETFAIIDEAMKSDEWDNVKFLLDGLILLINTDTGGQGKFLDLQASLVMGPSLNLLYRRLVDPLDRQFKTHYTSEKGVNTEEEDSSTTVENVLFQALSTIACLCCSFSWDEEDAPDYDHLIDEIGGESKALFIGTHLDKVSKEEFKKEDEILKQKVMNTEFYGKNLIEFASKSQLMLAVNNMSGDEREIAKIRYVLEQIIQRSFKKIAIPASWLMLSLCIRKTGVRTMSLTECEKLAGKLRIDRQELTDALWFLHNRIGILLYFPEIPSLRGVVICDIQIIFDSASNLIKHTFTFDKVGHKISQQFREKAQFSLRDVKKAASGHTDDLLPLEKLIDLLEDRNVLTVISSTKSSASQDPTYFMPCVLICAKLEELVIPHQNASDPPSLMLRYKCGFFPIGIFPAMITNLVSQQREDWQMIYEGLRKNRVQFHVGDCYDKVTLISHPRFLEVAISRREGFTTPTASLCAQVLSVVKSTLETVTSHLNYKFSMQYKLGFACPIHPDQSRDHICILAKESSSLMECLQDPKKRELVPLTPRHKIWFSPSSPPPPPPPPPVPEPIPSLRK